MLRCSDRIWIQKNYILRIHCEIVHDTSRITYSQIYMQANLNNESHKMAWIYKTSGKKFNTSVTKKDQRMLLLINKRSCL
jgi:hypothetical protein